MSEKVVLPTSDLAFKKLFASNQHKEILIGFLQDFYHTKIRDVTIKNPYSIKEFNKILKTQQGHYAVEVDLLCTTENNWNYHLELQVISQKFYMERALFYLSSNYQSTYGAPELMMKENKYSALCPTFSINILGHNYFDDDNDAVHTYTLYDRTHKQALCEPDLLTLSFFELRKTNTEEKLKHWQDLFLLGKVSKDAPTYIQKAAELIKITNFSKGERKMIDALEKAIQDQISREDYAMDKGLEKGRNEQKLKSALIMIRDLQFSLTRAMEMMEVPKELRNELITQLNKENIPYVL